MESISAKNDSIRKSISLALSLTQFNTCLQDWTDIVVAGQHMSGGGHSDMHLWIFNIFMSIGRAQG